MSKIQAKNSPEIKSVLKNNNFFIICAHTHRSQLFFYAADVRPAHCWEIGDTAIRTPVAQFFERVFCNYVDCLLQAARQAQFRRRLLQQPFETQAWCFRDTRRYIRGEQQLSYFLQSDCVVLLTATRCM